MKRQWISAGLLAFAIPGVFLLSACLGSSDSGSGSGGGTTVTSEIDGTWVTACTGFGQNGGGPPGTSYQKQTLTLGGGSFTYSENYFSDQTCATQKLVLTTTGTFTTGAAETTPAGSKDVTFVQSSQMATPQGGEAATLNTSGAGGGSVCTGVTFTDGTAVSIAGVNCSGGQGSSTQTANGATINGVYTLSGTTLTLGGCSGSNNQLGCVAPSGRPTQLNTTGAFTKQ